ncbi:V-type ATP synthase subunit E family protein [Peptoniphilus sp.]|jgi:vacuolar-type H+-ATPase subunit E/Vma4|uniref:V-type ATP synthase subunit E family protein n=1 Tax=Peptoniphilus sp. TaxID=1971214 RepID=UPI003D8F0856
MILLENKISIFNKIVFLKKKEECDALIKEEEEKAEKAIAEKVESLKKDREEYIKRRVSLAEKSGYEKIAKANEEKRVLALQEDEKLLNRLLASLENKLKEFAKTDEYVKFETYNFKRALDEIDEDSIYLYIRNDENPNLVSALKKVAEEKNVKLIVDELYDYHIGGFIISDINRSYNIDLSLKNRVEDMRYEIGAMLHNKLREAGDKNE